MYKPQGEVDRIRVDDEVGDEANRKIENPTERALATDSTIQPASSAHTASGARTDQDRSIFMSCIRGLRIAPPPAGASEAGRTTRLELHFQQR